MKYLKLLLLAITVVANVALWVVPGPVVQYIARDKHTLLGYYSVERFSAMLVLLLVSIVLVYLMFGKGGELRYRVIRVLVILIGIAGAVVAGELVLRAVAPEPLYVIKENFRSRPPHYQAEYVFHDKPAGRRSYPDLKSGYSPVSIRLETDEHGFRNPEGITRADVVFIGDSFTEGPEVAREQMWTSIFGEETGLTAYNLGTSGANPGDYAPKLEKIGLAMKPRAVVIMVYEGNDFRGHDVGKPTSEKSLLRLRLKKFLIDTLGPINADAPIRRGEIIDWLPLAVKGVNTTYYTFKPRNIGELYWAKDEFYVQRGWIQARQALEAASQIAKKNGIRLLVMYAPSKVHVALPLVIDDLHPDKVLEFAKLHRSKLPAKKRDMKDAWLFLQEFAQNIDVQQNAVQDLCAQLQVEFISLTKVLRQGMSEGLQTYYTYDQHWTPVGHKVVARKLIDYWARHP